MKEVYKQKNLTRHELYLKAAITKNHIPRIDDTTAT